MATPSLQQLMRYTLALSQFIGLFPVRGVMERDSSKLRFHWQSALVIYWFVSWIGTVFGVYRSYTVTTFRNPNGSLSAISNFSLLRTAGPPLVIYPLFLRIACRWPRFIQEWEQVEQKLVLRSSSKVLSCRIIAFTLIFAVLRFIFFVSGYIVAGVRIIQCEGVSTFQDFVHMLFQVRFPHIFSITSRSFWKYCVCAFLELTTTWSWLCSELIILQVSLILLEKFKIFNNHLKHTNLKASPHHWHVVRMEYVKLAMLTNMADTILSPFIFFIVILETMLVILFIYLVLTHSYTLLSYSYFLIFFLSHLTTDVITLVAMASIYDESKKPLSVLHNLPSVMYCFEAKRLYFHIKRSTVALTGCKFFVVTQTAIMSIISALVTYEVLLVQLGNLKHDSNSSELSDSNFCSWIELYLNVKQ